MDKLEEVATQVEEFNGLDALEDLQQHENEQIYNASVLIITEFFSVNEEEATGLEPEAASDVFVFNSNRPNQHIHF